MKRQRRVVQVLTLAGIVVAVAALLQEFGFLDYRSLVDHLPADASTSGPWSTRVLSASDSALGTLNYNRIYTAHFLAVGIIALLLTKRLSLGIATVVLLLLAGMLFTQSRTSFIGLLVGLTYGFIKSRRFGSRAATWVWVASIIAIIVIAVGFDPFSGGSIAIRTDTFSQSLDGRLEIQMSAVPIAMQDPLTLLLGVGVGNTGYFTIGGGFSPAHSQYVTVLTELGLLGLALFLFFYYRFFRAISPDTPIGLVAQSVLAGAVASAVFNDLLLPSPAFGSYLGLLFCLAGLGQAARRA